MITISQMKLRYLFFKINMLTLICMVLNCEIVQAVPELIWKKSFDSYIVETSDLIERSNHQKYRFPLSTVLTKNNVYSFNNKGEIINTIRLNDYDKATISKDGSTLAVLKGSDIYLKKLDDIINENYFIHIPQPSALSHLITMQLSYDGSQLVVISKYLNTIHFFDDVGTMINNQRLEGFKHASTQFSDNGEKIFLHLDYFEKGEMQGTFYIFNNSGKLLWAINHKGLNTVFDCSQNGQLLIYAAGNEVVLFNTTTGMTVFQKTIMQGNKNCSITNEGKHSVFNSNKTIYLLNNDTNDFVNKYSIPDRFDLDIFYILAIDYLQVNEKIIVLLNSQSNFNSFQSVLLIYHKEKRVCFSEQFNEKMKLLMINGYILLTGKNTSSLYNF